MYEESVYVVFAMYTILYVYVYIECVMKADVYGLDYENPASCSLGIDYVYCIMTKKTDFLHKTRNNFKLMNLNAVLLYAAKVSSYTISYGFLLSFNHRNFNQQCNKLIEIYRINLVVIM